MGGGQVREGFLEEVMGGLKEGLESVTQKREAGKSVLGRVKRLEQRGGQRSGEYGDGRAGGEGPEVPVTKFRLHAGSSGDT